MAKATRRLTESVVITALLPAIGYAIDRNDPFFLHYRFPWLLFAPLLVALRHGFTLGFSSAFALGIALIFGWRTKLVLGFPGEPIVGLVALAMIAGQFTELWKREVQRLEGGLTSVRKEADRLARSHLLLEASHDRLDEELQRKGSSLRDAMEASSSIPQGSTSLAAHGTTVMDVLAAHCGLEIGELFTVEKGAALGERCAVLGQPERTRREDPLLHHAVRSGRLAYIPVAPSSCAESASSLLAALPFVDAAGTVRAVLCVQAMSFTSFDKRNLATMVTIAAAFAERLGPAPGDRVARASLSEGAQA